MGEDSGACMPLSCADTLYGTPVRLSQAVMKGQVMHLCGEVWVHDQEDLDLLLKMLNDRSAVDRVLGISVL